MSNFQSSEDSSIVPQQSSQLIGLDEFKSLFYQLNAKPDTEIRLLRGKKILGLPDIRSINERISSKLRNHELISEIASISFILSNRRIKDYSTWAEFEREKWDTVNEIVRAITIKWDIAVKLPQYQLPQRHSLKIRIGTEIPPKDIFQLILTSDDITELMEIRTPSICKVDFINEILATELLNIVVEWYEGLQNLPEDNPFNSFLNKRGELLSEIIRYSLPVILLIIFYQNYDYLLPPASLENLVSLKSITFLLIVVLAIFITGNFLGVKLERYIDERISQLEEHPRFSITKGDFKEVEEFKKRNKTLKNEILWRLFWVLFSLTVSSLAKFIFQNIQQSPS
ncbi:hypothetical protein [Oscillatoria sp. FACHB-1406]|uniref:hypothetical protein n=1 Tax=Oscillatoria sp. FACHB-1406 TaxID=2692846 RepID=UPI0016839FFB|nr:hypothetical protein [Oscillatoria sp. FACHB-1406]MBD2577280.1 hypothetical protein [Oscillatoria sp. FACHB-1406]